MTTPSTPDTLWIPLAELQRAGLVAALPPDATAVTVQPLGAGIAAVKAPSGTQICVILSPPPGSGSRHWTPGGGACSVGQPGASTRRPCAK